LTALGRAKYVRESHIANSAAPFSFSPLAEGSLTQMWIPPTPTIEFFLALALVYVLVALVRAGIPLWSWLNKKYVKPRQVARLKKHRQSRQKSSSAPRRGKGGPGLGGRILVAVWRITDPLGGLAAFIQWLSARKDYTYWVGLALGEANPEKKVKYCSKAVRLNPEYEPAWGIKALTLLDLERYEEAMVSIDKVLELGPSATAWCRKGLCCYRLGRYSEAIGCFDKTLAICAAKDRQLSDEASRLRKLAARACCVSTDMAQNGG
jgi:tetratricopeptide (TPR) repeat protein